MKWIALSFFALVMCFSSVVEAGPMQDAVSASRRGDYATAYRLWLPEAERGNATAQYNIGLFYDKGRGRPKSARQAAEWYNRAVKKGHISAQVNLGTLYIRGVGVDRNYARAKELFTLAANRGSLSAQNNLGLVYSRGWGVEKNYREAKRWFLKAAQFGHAKAQYQMGRLYFKGFGVTKSFGQSLVWHRRAANQGIPRSMGAIGAMYLAGWGVPRNNNLAYTWLTIAANKGFKGGRKALDIASRNLSDRDITRAERNARAWRPKSRSQTVRVQRLLKRAKSYAGVVDGVSSGRLRSAIRSFQRRQGMEVTGRINGRLLARLRRAVGRNDPVRVGQLRNGGRPDGPSRTRPPRQARPDNSDPGSRRNPSRRRNRADGGAPSDAAQPDRRRRREPSRIGANPRTQPRRQPRRRTGRRSTGTGFFITKAGHILTNRHVVRRCVKLSIRWSDGETGNAKILKISKTADLALIKTDAKVTKIAKFRTGKRLRQGDDILVFGFPLSGLLSSSGNLTTGSVAALAGLRGDAGTMQISAPVQPGNSGGPVLDKTGRIVGVVVSKLNATRIARLTKDIPQNINFAIKATVATNFLEAQAISYAVDNDGKQKTNADNAEAAKAFTVQIKCTR